MELNLLAKEASSGGGCNTISFGIIIGFLPFALILALIIYFSIKSIKGKKDKTLAIVRMFAISLAIIFICCAIPCNAIGMKGGRIESTTHFGLLIMFLLLSASSFIAWGVLGKSIKNKNRNQSNEVIEQFSNGLDKFIEYRYVNPVENVFCSYVVGKDNNVYLLTMKKGQTRQAIVPFNEIIDCKIYKDDEVLGGVGRAVVGGILAGGVGAIVGSTTARKKVTNYKIAIIRNNIAEPLVEIYLIDTQTKTDNPVYKQADDFATKVYASVMAIISNNQK